MFPAFRIVSDGPQSGMDTFISNESFYAAQSGATEFTSTPQSGAVQDARLADQSVLLPGYMAIDQDEPPSHDTPDGTEKSK